MWITFRRVPARPVCHEAANHIKGVEKNILKKEAGQFSAAAFMLPFAGYYFGLRTICHKDCVRSLGVQHAAPSCLRWEGEAPSEGEAGAWMLIKLSILNWEKHNPKRDQKTYTWLRLQNDIATDKNLFGLTVHHRWAWICILCEASKANRGDLWFDCDWLADISKVSSREIHELLSFLEKKDIISMSLPPAAADAREPSDPTTPTNERTNGRTDVTIPLFPEPERSYVPTDQDGNELKARKEKKPKPPKDCSLIPEFETLKAAFDGKVARETQEAWKTAYTIPFVIQAVSKAYTWNAEKGFIRTNLTSFYGDWMRRDFEKLPSGHPMKQGGEKKKSAYVRQQEGENGQP